MYMIIIVKLINFLYLQAFLFYHQKRIPVIKFVATCPLPKGLRVNLSLSTLYNDSSEIFPSVWIAIGRLLTI